MVCGSSNDPESRDGYQRISGARDEAVCMF